MIRVLHTIDKLDYVRGSTSWLASMLFNMPKQGIEHIICCTSINKGDKEDEFFDKSIKIIHLPVNYKHMIKYIFLLKKVIKDENVAILHSHFGWVGALDALAAWMANIQHRLLYFHSGDWLHSGSFSRKIFSKVFMLIGKRTATHFASGTLTALQRWLPSHYNNKDKCTVISPGISFHNDKTFNKESIRKELDIPTHSWVIGHVGRLTPEKNHSAILKAFKSVCDKQPDAYLLLIGDGPLKTNLEALCKKLNIKDRVAFIGVRKDVYRCFRAMDVFVFPSKFESFGLSVLEAQDAALPVVSSNIPVLMEVLAPYWHKYASPPEDYHMLSNNLMKIKKEKMYRPDDFLERYSISDASKKLYYFYLDLFKK